MKIIAWETMQRCRMNTLLRNLTWRIGRRIYAHARGDVPNDPFTNGEYAFVQRVVGRLERGTRPIFLDVGANRGDWSAELLRACSARDLHPSIHAFEPCSSTYSALSDRFATSEAVSAHRLALSESRGTGELTVVAPLAGTNSLSSRQAGSRERVTLETVDEFLAAHDIHRVSMVKTDTEGFDFAVMKGARVALSEKLIDLWQFEYNWRWIDSRYYLRDVFDLAEACGYEVGRVMPRGFVELYEAWHPELERFFEANYCLVLRGACYEILCRRHRFNLSNVSEPVTGA